MSMIDVGRRYVQTELYKRYDSSSCSKFNNGDVLMARITPCLENGKICQAYLKNGKVGFGSTEFFVFRAKKDVLDQSFLFYLAKCKLIWQSAVNSMVGASGRQRADGTFLGKVNVNLPPLKTQRKIATILSAYDDLIENNNRRTAILENMAEQFYREWFVRLRFPGHEKAKTIKGVPEGWEVKKLRECFQTSSGGTPSRQRESEYYGGNIGWIKTGELKDTFIIDTDEKITNSGLKNSSAKLFPPFTLIMAMYGVNIGQLGITLQRFTTNQACCAFLPINMSHHSLYYLFFYLKAIREYLLNIGMGAAQQNLSQDIIRRLTYIKPPDDLLITFDRIQGATFENIINLKRRNNLLCDIRDRLHTRLMSGKINVEHMDIQFPPPMKEKEEVVCA